MLCYCFSKNVYFPWQVWLLANVCMHMTTKLCSRKPIQIPMIILYNILTIKLNIAIKYIGFQCKYEYKIANGSEIIIRFCNDVLVLYHLTTIQINNQISLFSRRRFVVSNYSFFFIFHANIELWTRFSQR